jgi:hypothetical protein
VFKDSVLENPSLAMRLELRGLGGVSAVPLGNSLELKSASINRSYLYSGMPIPIDRKHLERAVRSAG